MKKLVCLFAVAALLAGCTINIKPYIDAVNNAKDAAK